MNLPLTGKVVIVDDDPNQGLPLYKALCKAKIPSCYFEGRQVELPTTPFEDVRMLFLDLNLSTAQDGGNTLAIISSIITQIISPKTPYILILWSLNENDLIQGVLNLFTNQLQDYRPLKTISLQKSTFFRIENGNYEPVNNIVNRIAKRLHTQMLDRDIIEAIIKWENFVQKSIGQTIKDFVSIFNNDEFWNVNFKHLLYKMAVAQVGENVDRLTDEAKLYHALLTLNGSLFDTIQSNINRSELRGYIGGEAQISLFSKRMGDSTYTIEKNPQGKFVLKINGTATGNVRDKINQLPRVVNQQQARSDIQSIVDEMNKIPSVVNQRLIIDSHPHDNLQPGNIFRISLNGNRKRKLLENYFKSDFLKRNADRTFSYGVSLITFIELEVTPICDYAQNKRKKVRLISGIIFPSEYYDNLRTADYFYKVAPSFIWQNESRSMIFDFRFFKSKYPEEITDTPIFRLRNELFIDIMAKVSNNINRPGVTFVE